MGTPVVLFKATGGLDTLSPPDALAFDAEKGTVSLQKAVNVDVEAGGRVISSRRSVELKQAGSFHSGFGYKGTVLCVKEVGDSASLYKVNGDYTLTGLRSGLVPGLRMGYCGVNDQIYYGNGVDKGIVEGGVSVAWELPAEVISHYSDIDVSGPPNAVHMAVMGGYMLAAEGSVLWISQEFAFNQFELMGRFVDFTDRVLMIKAVEGGAWVGTRNEVVFLDGTNPREWEVRKRIAYGVKEFCCTAMNVSASLMRLDLQYGLIGEGYVFLSERGICWAGNNGQFKNLTEDRIAPEDFVGVRGAALRINERVVLTTE